ncbi:unnamed protein product [Gongylonema pulchrum]|uniref:Uncharacterized protein n=1 Tax=Gongylonema pulchrum TaxID=637853 RepID=A0A183ESY9_9BILA|nr:unnamed protein product [Gongylonema pulchrum]
MTSGRHSPRYDKEYIPEGCETVIDVPPPKMVRNGGVNGNYKVILFLLFLLDFGKFTGMSYSMAPVNKFLN